MKHERALERARQLSATGPAAAVPANVDVVASRRKFEAAKVYEMQWVTGNWSILYRVTDRDETAWYHDASLREPGKRPGVYRLVALANESDLKPRTLNRVCGQDTTGTIYLGAAANLLVRVGDLVATHHPKFRSQKHRVLPAKLAEMLSPQLLEVCFQHVDEGLSPFDREHELMTRYYEAFGERPPLNRQG